MLSPSYEKEGKKLDKQNIKNYINDPYIGVSPSATIFYMAPILAIAGKAGWVRRIPLESFEKGVAFFKMYIKRMT